MELQLTNVYPAGLYISPIFSTFALCQA